MSDQDRQNKKPSTQRPETDAFWDYRFAAGIVPWDAGDNGRQGMQAAFIDFVRGFTERWPHRERPRVLIPGCGSAYEAVLFAELGWQVTAIDFSAAAIAAAKRVVGEGWSGRLCQADFFTFADPTGFDFIYERAFLCALPRKLWTAYAGKIAGLIRPQGLLAGYFYFSEEPIGPPFGIDSQRLDALLGAEFDCLENIPVTDSVAMFSGRERWLIWQRKKTSGM